LDYSTITDKNSNNKIKDIIHIIENTSIIAPAKKEIETTQKIANTIIKEYQDANKNSQEKIKDYDIFIKSIKDNNISLINEDTTSIQLSTPILTIDNTTKNILTAQEDPNESYLKLNNKMVE